MAVSEPYQGRIRAVSEECESHIKRVSGQYPSLSFLILINFEFKTVASPILILVFNIFNSNFVFWTFGLGAASSQTLSLKTVASPILILVFNIFCSSFVLWTFRLTNFKFKTVASPPNLILIFNIFNSNFFLKTFGLGAASSQTLSVKTVASPILI